MSTVDLPPLIGDPDAGFLQKLLAQRQSSPAAPSTPILASTAAEIERALENPGQSFSGIFINPKIIDPWGIPILSRARQLRPSTPIFYIHDEEIDAEHNPLSSEHLRQLTVTSMLRKPLNYQDIAQAIQGAIAAPTATPDPLVGTTEALEKDFVSILAGNFVAGTASFFDVYVRIVTDKYVKVLNAGDAFAPERLGSYLQRGVTHFYLRRDSQEQYLRYCEQISSLILKTPGVAQEVKVAQVLNHGQETLSFLRQAGLKESTVRYAEVFAENVHELVKGLRLDQDENVRAFLDNLVLVDHGVATAMVAALLSQPLKFEADRSVGLIGLASMFHDIGLIGADQKLVDEQVETMTAEELLEYHKHPKRGADILSKVREISPTVVQAVAQHHERRNRQGFPDRIGSGVINRVAEVIGISEEFVHLVGTAARDKRIDPLRLMELRVFDGFSMPVIGAFRGIFPGKRS